MPRTVSRRAVTEGFLAASAGLAIDTALPRKVRATPVRNVTLMLDVTPYGKHAMFYPAIENGYFRDLGLDVTFQAGKGSADVAVKVAAGAAEAGFADAATAILARAKGAKIKEVMMVHYLATNSAVTDVKKPAREPKDMMGMKMGATAGDAPRVALPALAAINKFDASKIEIITMESSAKPAMFIAGQIDGLLTLTVYTPVLAEAARRAGREIVEIRFSDFGLDIYSNGIIVRDETLQNEPDLVRKLTQALVESFIFTVENPEKAVEMFSKHNPVFNKDVARKQLAVAIDHLMVDEVKKHGIGPMSAQKMKFTIDIVRDYFGMQGEVELDDVYTNEFVTAGQKPKV